MTSVWRTAPATPGNYLIWMNVVALCYFGNIIRLTFVLFSEVLIITLRIGLSVPIIKQKTTWSPNCIWSLLRDTVPWLSSRIAWEVLTNIEWHDTSTLEVPRAKFNCQIILYKIFLHVNFQVWQGSHSKVWEGWTHT